MGPHPGVLRLTNRYEDLLAGEFTISSRDTEQVSTTTSSPSQSPEREVFETSQDWSQLDSWQESDHDRFMRSRVTDWQEKTFFTSQCDGLADAPPMMDGHGRGEGVTNTDKLDWGGVFQKLRSASASSGSSRTSTCQSGTEHRSPISSTTTASPVPQRHRDQSPGASPTIKTAGARLASAVDDKTPRQVSITLPRSTCSAGDSTLRETTPAIIPKHVKQNHSESTEHVAIKSSDTQADLEPDTTEQRIAGRFTHGAITNDLLDEIINSKTIIHSDVATLQKLAGAQAKFKELEGILLRDRTHRSESKDGKWEPGLLMALLLFMVPWVLCIGVVKVLF